MTPADVQAADAVRRALARLQRRLRGLRQDHGVSASKLSLLGQLHRAGGPLTGVELARLERLQPQSLTRAVAELDAAGLLSRQAGVTDRRQVLLTITPAGRALLVQDARLQNAWLASRLSAVELTTLAEGLERLLF